MLEVAKTLLLRAWESIQSQKSVDEIKIQVTKLIQVYSRGISAARRIMVILDGIFEYSTPKRLAKAQPPTPHELNHDIRTLP